jgi:hypothetical protein
LGAGPKKTKKQKNIKKNLAACGPAFPSCWVVVASGPSQIPHFGVSTIFPKKELKNKMKRNKPTIGLSAYTAKTLV